MDRIYFFIFLASAVALDFARAQENTTEKSKANPEDYEDAWAKDLRISTKTCRGRLPNALEKEDMDFAMQLSKASYIKYADQVSFLRTLDAIITTNHGQNRPLSQVLCLFESPCMIIRDFHLDNSSVEVCNGDVVRFQSKLAPDGLVESMVKHEGGRPDVKWAWVPTFTDRKSFVTTINCMMDGTMGFLVLANRPGLSAYTRHLIKEHLDNSGFRDHFRVSTAFMSSTCKNRL